MIKELKISHIILIEQAHISFEKGFTVLSGETGAGKSAVMEALKLVLGARTDTGLIRHGAEKGSCIAVFDLQSLPKARAFLAEKGIDSDDPNLLILQREITASGKTRAAINHQPVQLSLLRELSEYLLELVSQHANHKLFHLDQHRISLDLYGSYNDLKQEYENTWKTLQTLTHELQTLKNALPSSLREIEVCEREIKEIQEAAIKEGEEESLFATYSLLATAGERQSSVQELLQTLGSERGGVFSLLSRVKPAFNALQAADPTLKEELELFPQLLIETEELVQSLRKYEAKLDADPQKLSSLQKRLTLIERFKRKYGNTIEEMATYCEKQQERLETLRNLETELEEKTALYQEKLIQTQKLAEKLSQERKKCAEEFSKKMTASLKNLNMKTAAFQIEFTNQPLNLHGQDKVEFFLHTNVGEKMIALKDSASGGELARVLLALYVLLADKEKIGTLIFDEIDANIGGTTAALMGEHLKTLGKAIQIISITHFPQVAKCAEHHLQIAKSTQNGRTTSQVHYISGLNRKEELSRMSGTATLEPSMAI